MFEHKGTQTLRTERLVLRKYELSDAQDMFKNYAADERVTKFLTWLPYTNTDDVEEFIRERIAEYDDLSNYNWVIELGGEVVGSISVINGSDHHRNCEVGYCLGCDFWNKGIMAEALAAVIKFLFEEVGMNRIIAKHNEKNPASGRVMQKCGMTHEATFRQHYRMNDGKYYDSILYRILREEYNAKA